MKAKTKTTVATATIANRLTRREINKLRRLYAEFYDRREKLDLLAEAYPAAIAAIDEYAGMYPHAIGTAHGKRALNHSLMLNNDLACVTGANVVPYAADAVAAVTVKGDQPGDAVPAEVVQGLQYLRHRLPKMYARLVGMDAAIGPSLQSDGVYAASALLMRSALAAA